MGRTPVQPLLARHVADHYGVTVWSPDDIAGVPSADLQQLLGAGHQEWSGFTLRVEDRHLIVVNTAHSARRQNSVVMHELAHIILGHGLQSGAITDQGFLLSTYDQDQEDEAAWLGGTLLLPRPALMWMRCRGLSDQDAADYFSVSLDLLRWRIRMTGIDYQLKLAGR